MSPLRGHPWPRPRLPAFLAALALLVAHAAPAAASAAAGEAPAEAIASAALIADPARWDSRAVAFVGEAVGEAMFRGGHAWLQLNDDPYRAPAATEAARTLHGYNSGLAAWAPERLARDVRRFGGYRGRGDLVRVLGTFHATCPEHGGDMDLHVASLRVVEEGFPVAHPLRARRFALGIGLLVLAGALGLLRRRPARGSGGAPAGERRG